jgi:hypothetical protein
MCQKSRAEVVTAGTVGEERVFIPSSAENKRPTRRTKMPVLELSGVTKTYGRLPALDSVDLEVEAGLALFGAMAGLVASTSRRSKA